MEPKMKKLNINKLILSEDGGFSIVETLLSLLISMTLFAGMTQQYFSISRLNRDLRVKQTADRYARTIVNILGFDLRIVGNGIPFDQPDFQISEDALNLTSPLSNPEKKIQPIVLDSVSSTEITLRLSESGEMYVLNSDFTPSVSLSFVLTDVTGLAANNKIYISNGSVAEAMAFTEKYLQSTLEQKLLRLTQLTMSQVHPQSSEQVVCCQKFLKFDTINLEGQSIAVLMVEQRFH
jgi:hypothetical protein